MCQREKQRQVTLGADLDEIGRRLGRLGRTRINHHNARIAAVAADALPEDGMGDAQVGPDEHDDVALFEIVIASRWSIEAKRLLVSRHSSGHALACIGVTVEKAHAEFEQTAKKRHLLKWDLAGREECNGLRTIRFNQMFEAADQRGCGGGPVGWHQGAAGIAEEWRHGSIRSVERIESMPAFWAGHAKIDRVGGIRGKVAGGTAFVEMEGQSASGGAVSAGGNRRCGGLEAAGQHAQTVSGGFEYEVLGEGTRIGSEQRLEGWDRHGWHGKG